MTTMGRTEQHVRIKKLALATFLLGGILSANAAFVITTLPDGFEFQSVVTITEGTIGNGNFEGSGSGSTANWYVSGPLQEALQEVSDTVASEGTWSLRIYEEGLPKVSSRSDHRRRSIGLNGLTDGDIFHITLDFYLPVSSNYNQLVLQPLTMNGSSMIELGTGYQPRISTGSWVPVDVYYQAETTGFNGLDLRVMFNRNGGDLATYEGYIDNVIIKQGIFAEMPPPPGGTVIVLR